MDRSKKGALDEKRTVVYSDEVGMQLLPNVCRTWSPVGSTPVLEHQAGRDKVSLLGGLVWKPTTGECDLLLHMYPKDNIDSPKIITFFDALHGDIEGPITVVLDNLKAHHSKLVQQYVKDNESWLQLVFLPPYCPELNPIEYVWSAWKRTYLANCCPKNTNQLCDILFANEHAMCDQNLLKGCILASKLFSQKEMDACCGL